MGTPVRSGRLRAETSGDRLWTTPTGWDCTLLWLTSVVAEAEGDATGRLKRSDDATAVLAVVH